MSIERRNCGSGHTYRIDAKTAIGVTKVLNEGIPKPALVNWAAEVTADYALDHWDELDGMRPSERRKLLLKARYSERDSAAKRGKDVHAIAELLSHGQEVDVPDELAGHVNACVKFLDEWQVRPILTETVVASRKWGYAGTFDLIAELPTLGQIALLDYKTGRSGIWGETALQLAGYAHADIYLDEHGDEHPMNEVGITHAYAVWLRADGYDVHPLDISDDTFRTFQYALTIARRLGSLKSLVGPSIDPTGKAVA